MDDSQGWPSRDLGPNGDGCSDAIHLMCMLDSPPREPAARAALVSGVEGMQDSAAGLFGEATPRGIHTTPGYLLAAIAPPCGVDALALTRRPGSLSM